MRIVSLIPSATEICFAIGLGEQVVGVTHECDFPAEAQSLARITRSRVDSEHMSSIQIDDAITEMIRGGEGIYELDEEVLKELRPDLILTQALCAVCAVSFEDVRRTASRLDHPCQVISLDPKCIGDVLKDIELVGELTQADHEADDLIASLRRRIGRIGIKTSSLNERPVVFSMEWIDPPFCGGHWVPEMVDVAGGIDPFGARGQDSTRVTWDAIASRAPDTVVVIPCGFGLERTRVEYQSTVFPSTWQQVPAVREARVFAADANAYFSRCGPRLVDGIEVLAEILHPQLFSGIAPRNSWLSLIDNDTG